MNVSSSPSSYSELMDVNQKERNSTVSTQDKATSKVGRRILTAAKVALGVVAVLAFSVVVMPVVLAIGLITTPFILLGYGIYKLANKIFGFDKKKELS